MKQPAFSFNPYKFPSAKYLSYAFILLIAGGVLFFAPVLVLDVQSGSLHASAVNSVKKFELTDELQAGIFKSSDRTGDTARSWEATFRGVSILGTSSNPDGTKAYVQQEQATGFGKNIKQLYEGIVLLKKLSLLNNPDVATQLYNQVLALGETNSAFRLNSRRASSVTATYYAFEAIHELGKFNEFKTTEQYTSSISFVAAQKEEGGYHNVPSENATVSATFEAINVLKRADLSNEETKTSYFGNLTNFLLRSQNHDGGFRQAPSVDPKDAFETSRTTTTLQAIYVMEYLKSIGVSTLSITDSTNSKYKESFAYLRATLSSSGVAPGALLKGHDLEATYYFNLVVNTFPHISYGVSREFQYLLTSLSFIAFVGAAFFFFKEQVATSVLATVTPHFRYTLIALGLGYLALKFVPGLALVVFFFYAFYLVIEAYKIEESEDTVDGLLVLVASLITFVFLGASFGLHLLTPPVFTQFYALVSLLVLSLLTTFVVTLGAAYFSKHKRLTLFAYGAFLGWAVNTIFLLSFLYGRGDGDVTARFIYIKGYLPVVVLGVPYATLGLTYASVGAALYVFQNTPFLRK